MQNNFSNLPIVDMSEIMLLLFTRCRHYIAGGSNDKPDCSVVSMLTNSVVCAEEQRWCNVRRRCSSCYTPTAGQSSLTAQKHHQRHVEHAGLS